MTMWILFLAFFRGLLANSPAGFDNSTSPDERYKTVIQMVSSSCIDNYTSGCIQFEFLTRLDRVLNTSNYEVIPGVFLNRQNVSLPEPPLELTDTSRDLSTTTQVLNSLLAERMFQQLRTWSIKVYVFGNSTLDRFRKVMDLYLLDQQEVEGRKFKYWKFMGGVLVTAAFSVLSALISKSLTMSLLAIAISLLGGRNNFGFGAPAAAPTVSLRVPAPVRSHTAHTSEMQYVDDLPDDGQQPYVYVNRKSWKTARKDDEFDKYYNKGYYV